MKNQNQASSKPNRTRPEYRSHTGPPAQTEKPVCTASPLCEGCPFPGHGFLCQGEDGECIDREQLEKLRGTCVAQVKRSNGVYAFEDAFDFQKR